MTTTIKILRNDGHMPAGKLADAELHFVGGDLDGLKLIGFAVWQRRDGNGQNVTFPARPFRVLGERRHFALLRAVDDPSAPRARAARVRRVDGRVPNDTDLTRSAHRSGRRLCKRRPVRRPHCLTMRYQR